MAKDWLRSPPSEKPRYFILLATRKALSGMNIVVVRFGPLKNFPPAVNLVESLLRLGHHVVFFASDIKADNKSIALGNPSLECIDLHLSKGNIVQREKADIAARKLIRSYLADNKASIDVVWTTTDVSAREVGKALYGFTHVMQLSELVSYVPLIGNRAMPFHSNETIELARRAYKVVVPEYNRACIQQMWWKLPQRPTVLPNKPQTAEVSNAEAISQELCDRFSSIHKKILLYQGYFTPDREFRPFAECLRYLSNEYALCMMGRAQNVTYGRELEASLNDISEDVHFMGNVDAPNHLAFTKFGRIGLLPYSPSSSFNRYSELNGLYCAPNKVWEYSRIGLPMLGSDVPGNRYTIEFNRMGFVTDMDPVAIANKVREIDERYDEMSGNAKRFYASIDVDQIVASILGM
jgi:glycosyltransferase involved in cell wall biosynthesis